MALPSIPLAPRTNIVCFVMPLIQPLSCSPVYQQRLKSQSGFAHSRPLAASCRCARKHPQKKLAIGIDSLIDVQRPLQIMPQLQRLLVARYCSRLGLDGPDEGVLIVERQIIAYAFRLKASPRGPVRNQQPQSGFQRLCDDMAVIFAATWQEEEIMACKRADHLPVIDRSRFDDADVRRQRGDS